MKAGAWAEAEAKMMAKTGKVKPEAVAKARAEGWARTGDASLPLAPEEAVARLWMKASAALAVLSALALLVALLLASPAWAQAGVSRGGALKKRQYQTYSTLTLYMSPSGNDSNSCTSASAPCYSFNGIYAKLPKVLRHNVTVNVAAGNYTFDSRWDGVQWSSVATSGISSITVTFQGPPLTNVTLSSGSPTGTITSLTTTNPPLPTITDSSQSWTPGELKGYFLVITSGPRTNHIAAIVDNTATTITHIPWSSPANVPAVGDSYAIQKPAAVINGSQVISGHTGGTGSLSFRALEFTSSAANTTTLSVLGNQRAFSIGLGASRVIRTGSGGFSALSLSESSGNISSAASPYQNAFPVFMSTGASTGPAVVLNSPPPTRAVDLRGYAYSASSAAANFFLFTGVPVSWTTFVAETGSTSSDAILFGGSTAKAVTGGLVNGYLYALCPAGSTGRGVFARGDVFVQSSGPIAAVNCSTGFFLGSYQFTVYERGHPFLWTYQSQPNSTLYCQNTTTCLNLNLGGRFQNTTSTPPTFIGVTNEYVVDGDVYTHAFVSSLSPRRVVGSLGSILELE